MKDIDDMLRAALPRPARELSSNFSARVVEAITARETESQKENSPMKMRFAPMIATIIAAALVLMGGGVTYAATDGFTKPFNLENIFGYTTVTEPSGEKVLTAQTNDCTVGSTVRATGNVDQTLYFRLKDASVSEEDALKWLQGYCERTALEAEVSVIRGEQDGSTSLGGGTVKSLDGNILTTQFQLGEGAEAVTYEERYDIRDARVARVKSVGNTFNPGDEVDILANREGSGSEVIWPAIAIIHYSGSVTFYNANIEKFQAALERVRPGDDGKFYTYGSGEATTDEEKEAVEFVKNAYEPYKTKIADESQEWPQRYLEANREFTAHTTVELATQLDPGKAHAGDMILCAQNAISTDLSYGAPTRQGSTITVPVLRPEAAGYNDDGTPNLLPPAVFADVKYSLTEKKIVSIDCTITLAR